MSHLIEEIILKNITLLENVAKGEKVGSKRSVLNKWFQDTVKAYIMEKVAAPLLIAPLKASNPKEVRVYVNKSLSKEVPSYISIIVRYF